jgi:hypothetical protein
MHQIDTAGSTKQRINNEPKQRIHEFTNHQANKKATLSGGFQVPYLFHEAIIR